jgi:hypothetical protein
LGIPAGALVMLKTGWKRKSVEILCGLENEVASAGTGGVEIGYIIL